MDLFGNPDVVEKKPPQNKAGLVMRDYQLRAVEAIRGAWQDGDQAVCIVAATGTGKCLGRDTPVLMFDGTIKPVQNVVHGDKLMGPDSTPRRVLSTCQGIGPLFKVTPTKGAPYIVNDAHILSLKMTPRKGGETHEVIDISVSDYLSSGKTFKHRAKGYRVGVDFEYRKVPLAPYFVGLWLGDGHAVGPTITTPDPEIVECLREFAYENDAKLSEYSYEGRCPSYAITTERGKPNHVLDAMRGMDLVENKHVPLIYKANSKAVRQELLAGLLDSDGHASGHGCHDVAFKHKVLADDCAFVARSLGLAAYVKQCQKTCTNTGATGTYYRISISGNFGRIPFRIERKRPAPRRQIKNPLVTGIKVEPCGRGDYYGFVIDGDKRFLLGDFTVTHNTEIAIETIKRELHRGRAIVLVHQRELVKQAAARIRKALNVDVCIEMADDYAKRGGAVSPVVVCSKDTMVNDKRRDEFDPSHFATMWVDEAHHAVSDGYVKVIDHFKANPDMRVFGVTATPDRLDEKSLGMVFDSVPFTYELPTAIRDGWLVPIKVKPLNIDGVDISQVGKVGNDLNQGQLAEQMEREAAMLGVVDAVLREYDNKQTLLFTVRVHQAKLLMEMFNDRVPDIARYVHGGTPSLEREQIFRDYKKGRYKILCNVGVVTEGVDLPTVEVVAMARPTLSRALYAQMIGRGTRTLPGIVSMDMTAEERRAAIAASAKPHMMILDFMGVTGKHELVTPMDVLGADYDDDTIAEAVKQLRDGEEIDVLEVLEAEDQAREERIEKETDIRTRAKLIGCAHYNSTVLDLFEMYGIHPKHQRGWDTEKPVTEKQAAAIVRITKGSVNPEGMSMMHASQVLDELIGRIKKGLCTHKQCKWLEARGYPTEITIGQASRVMDACARNGWRKLPLKTVHQIIAQGE